MVVAGTVRTEGELRKARRQRLRYVARILVDQHGTTRRCLISNISESGARLLTEEDGELPAQFILLLNHSGAARRVCELVWRNGKATGVRFMNSPADVRNKTAR